MTKAGFDEEKLPLDVSAWFHRHVKGSLDRIAATQTEVIQKAAGLVADAVAADHMLYAFGCGHSQSVATEFYYRAGGLALCDVIHDPTFGRAERISGYAEVLLESYPVTEGDVLIVISNSGRNPVPVEMALGAHRRGMTVVGITSLRHSRSVTPRPPLTKRLFEVCDLVIDNCSAAGDAALELTPGLRVGATSTVTGAYISQDIISLAAAELLRRGIRPPIFVSKNLDQGDGHNEEVQALFRRRVRGI